MAEPDVLTMARSGLLAALIGEWEIIHKDGSIYGRVVVKSLKDAAIFTHEVQPCTFSFRHRDRPEVKATKSCPSIVTIHWEETSYAILESFGRESLTWKSPPLHDGGAPSYNTWRRTRVSASQTEAPDELTEVRLKAAEELSKVRAKAADDLAELNKKATLSEELAEARAKVADEIAEENESLRSQLKAQTATSESLQRLVRTLVMEVQSMGRESSLLKDSSLESVAVGKSRPPDNPKQMRKSTPSKLATLVLESPVKCVKEQDQDTPKGQIRSLTDQDTPKDKKRRIDPLGNNIGPRGFSLAAGGA